MCIHLLKAEVSSLYSMQEGKNGINMHRAEGESGGKEVARGGKSGQDTWRKSIPAPTSGTSGFTRVLGKRPSWAIWTEDGYVYEILRDSKNYIVKTLNIFQSIMRAK